jgi:hypothetical protein
MSMGSARRGKVGNTGTFVATETMKKPHPSLSFTRSLLFVSAINNTASSRIPTAASWHLQNSPIPSPLAQSRPQSARASEPYLRRRPQIRRPHPAKSAAPIPGRRAPAPPFPPGVLPPDFSVCDLPRRRPGESLHLQDSSAPARHRPEGIREPTVLADRLSVD